MSGANSPNQKLPFRNGAVSTSFDDDDRDAFGRARVSQPITVFSTKQVSGTGLFELYFNNKVTGSGQVVYDNSISATKLMVSNSGDYAARETKRYLNYYPGRSHLIMVTMSCPSGDKAGNRNRVGLFDDSNGIYFENDQGNYNFVLRSSTSGVFYERRIPQSQWNLDRLDGSKGFKLSACKGNIYVIDLQWLGVGDVRVGVSENGMVRWAHKFHNDNMYDAPYITTPDLPIRWENEAVGNQSGVVALNTICATVLSEGGDSPPSVIRAIDNGLTPVGVNNSTKGLLAVRTSGVYSKISLEPVSLDIGIASAATVFVEIYIGGTLSSGVWTNIDGGGIQKSTSFTYNPGNAVKLDSFYVFQSNRVHDSIVHSSVLTGLEEFGGDVSQPIVIVATKSTAGAVNTYASLKIREQL